MNDTSPPITGQAAKLTTTRVDDDTTLVCTVHLNAKPVFAECSAVTRDGTSRRVGKSPSGWKVDSASAEAYDDGTVRLWLSSYPDGASGTEAAVRYLDFPDALPPSAAVETGGEVYAPAPGGYIRIKSVVPDGPPYSTPTGQPEEIALPAAIPHGVAGLHLKMMLTATDAGVRGFVGSDANEGGMFVVYTQAPGERVSMEGRRAPSAAQSLFVAAPYGSLTELYVDILGWWSVA